MPSRSSFPKWIVRVNAEITRPIAADADVGRVAAMFGLGDGQTETLYRDFPVEVAPGEIVAVTGPSGAGKSVLLREVAARVPDAVPLRTGALARSRRPAVTVLAGGSLAGRLEVLSRCGLAEAGALVTPARYLSGGQRLRLALAEALHSALVSGRPRLVVADEFATGLDATTARLLCGRVRKLVSGSSVGLLLATPRSELIGALRPDRLIVKPLGAPAEVVWSRRPGGPVGRSARWPVQRGSIHDYHELAGFHYLAGPPAAHKRVLVVRPTGRSALRRWDRAATPHTAAVLVVSPPVPTVRGRNLATGGRYAGADRSAALQLLNEEVECISRVVVHPMYRGCGLATRLVREALATAGTPLVEALAAMGQVHPFFERAGMAAATVPPAEPMARLLSAADAVGLSAGDLAAVRPVRALLGRRSRAAGFLRAELARAVAETFSAEQFRRLADPVAEICRRTTRRYVYYLYERAKES